MALTFLRAADLIDCQSRSVAELNPWLIDGTPFGVQEPGM